MQRQKILVADDDPDIVDIIQTVLEGEGFQVLVAADGEEALRKVKEERPDLLLLDIMMPKLDGYQVCQQVKDDVSLSSIPVVIISARGQKSDKDKGFRAGVCDYIVKPFDPLELPEIVRRNLTCPPRQAGR